MGKRRLGAVVAAAVAVLVGGPAAAQAPDHPVITEVYQEPPSLGGPVGRNPADPHQEFIEIYLPTLADLAPGLNKDALNVTFYDVEGDSTSPGHALVNYRIDLPTFDLDPSNGLTGLPRPSSGVVVLGWVDYVGNPPTDLAGTPNTRLALINGGVTSTTDFTFIAINGAQFSGTTNFPVPLAISHIDTVSDPVTGKIEQGSGVFLLVDRDAPGYASLCGQTDPGPCNSFPNLATGTPLGVSSLFDAFAANDDQDFLPELQPYQPPTGDNIDLEFVLPLGGVYSLLVPQVQETADGYQRVFVDHVKTSEDPIPGNEDPALDSITAYLTVDNLGPFFPTPGYAPSTTDPARLSVAAPSRQATVVLTDTLAWPGVLAANIGGNFGMHFASTPGPSSNPSAMLIAAAAGSSPLLGRQLVEPPVEVETFVTTGAGYIETVAVQIDAIPSGAGDPPVETPSGSTSATYTSIDPTTGLDALLLPYQATAFVAGQSFQDDAAVPNEFLATSLGQAMSYELGTTFRDSRGHGPALVDPSTDLSNPLVVGPLVATMPTNPLAFINAPGTGGDLVSTVLGSAEVVSGRATYENSLNAASTLVQAVEFTFAAPVPTTGGFTPLERVYYANSLGRAGELHSGLSNVLTRRDFELALVDTQLRATGTLELGAADDFGVVVRVASVRAGATAAIGELIFLSMTGGFEGADFDTLDLPPHGNLATIVYVDLDPLDSVMGITGVGPRGAGGVDGSGGSELDVIDVIKLPEPTLVGGLIGGLGLLSVLSRRRAAAASRPC